MGRQRMRLGDGNNENRRKSTKAKSQPHSESASERGDGKNNGKLALKAVRHNQSASKIVAFRDA